MEFSFEVFALVIHLGSCHWCRCCIGMYLVGMCIPQHLAEEVLDHAEEHERAEVIVKKMILDEGVAPGKYCNTETFERIERDGK